MSDEGEKSSWLEPLPEEYVTEGDMTGRRMFIAALTVIILAIFGGLIWYSYLDGNDNGPVPVVRADKSVVKEKPDTPGGMQVPDQDKQVFSRVAEDNSSKDEKLAPSAELPLELLSDSKALEEAKLKAAKAEEGVKDAILPPKEKTEPIKKEVDVASTKKIDDEFAAISPAGNGKKGNLLVQLGAFGKKSSAEQLWSKLQKDNQTLLSGLSSDIMMVDLGKKGVLYRLRGGMIESRAAADKICAALKAKKQACIVVTK